MSYTLTKTASIAAIGLLDFNGTYRVVIQLSNGQYLIADPFNLFIAPLGNSGKYISNNPVYWTSFTSLKGRFLAFIDGMNTSNIPIWNIDTHEKFILSPSDSGMKFAYYGFEYHFGHSQISAVYPYYHRPLFSNNNNGGSYSEDGDLIYVSSGIGHNSPSIGQYSVSEKRWKYVCFYTDVELDRVSARKYGAKFEFTFPSSIFTGRYIKATTQGSGTTDMLFDHIKTIITGSATLPELVGGVDCKINTDRIFVHTDDAKIYQGTSSSYLRVFYRCFYSGEERWCFADLNNITDDYILISDTHYPYESIQLRTTEGEVTALEAFTNKSSVTYTCTNNFVPIGINDEAFWLNMIYAFGIWQFSRFFSVGSYDSSQRENFKYYVDRETEECLNPNLIDRHQFYHSTRGLITREDFYFDNSTGAFYLCNFHGQYGYDNNDTWMMFTKDYLGNWCFPRYDHASQPYGSKFVYLDPTDPLNLYNSDTNPTGVIISAITTTVQGGSSNIIDLLNDANYFTVNGVDFINLLDKMFIKVDAVNVINNLISMTFSVFNDKANPVVRTTTINNLALVYGDTLNVYEINNVAMSIGVKYDPFVIYDVNDFSNYKILRGGPSSMTSIVIDNRYIVVSGYPNNVTVIDLEKGLETTNADIVNVYPLVKDTDGLTQKGTILYWVSQHRRVLSYYYGIVFGCVNWQHYLETGNLVSTWIDGPADINHANSVDLRVNQLGLIDTVYDNADVETAVVDWIANYKEVGESDAQARDRLIALLKGSIKYEHYGISSDDSYVYLNLNEKGNYAMIGCSFADSSDVLHTYNEDLATNYPALYLIDITSVTVPEDLNDLSIYHKIEIQGVEWIGKGGIGHLVAVGDYIMFFPEYVKNTNVTAEFDGTNWCVPVYSILKATLISAISTGYVDSSDLNKILIPCAATEAAAKTAFNTDSAYDYRLKNNYAVTPEGIVYAGISNDLSYVNGLGQTIVPSVVRVNPATSTYEYVCGLTSGMSLAPCISYNSIKDVLWVTLGNTSYRLENISTVNLALLI